MQNVLFTNHNLRHRLVIIAVTEMNHDVNFYLE